MDPTVPAPNPALIAPKPVMDVVPPHPAEPVKMPPQEGTAPAAQPAAPVPSKTKADDKPAQPKPTTPKPAKAPRGGGGLAVAATIVIILGLGAMMTYAYLRTQGINPF